MRQTAAVAIADAHSACLSKLDSIREWVEKGRYDEALGLVEKLKDDVQFLETHE